MSHQVDDCVVMFFGNGNENRQTSSQDRMPCETEAVTPGDNKFLNVHDPLQLGGRNNTELDYPRNIMKDGFHGCIKNFMHNGEVNWLSDNLIVKLKSVISLFIKKIHNKFFNSFKITIDSLYFKNRHIFLLICKKKISAPVISVSYIQFSSYLTHFSYTTCTWAALASTTVQATGAPKTKVIARRALHPVWEADPSAVRMADV